MELQGAISGKSRATQSKKKKKELYILGTPI